MTLPPAPPSVGGQCFPPQTHNLPLWALTPYPRPLFVDVAPSSPSRPGPASVAQPGHTRQHCGQLLTGSGPALCYWWMREGPGQAPTPQVQVWEGPASSLQAYLSPGLTSHRFLLWHDFGSQWDVGAQLEEE